MGNQDLKNTLKSMEELRAELASSPAKALAFLVKAGIVTPEGQLTAPYTQSA